MAEYIDREALQRNIKEEIEACGEEDSVYRPIAYGSIFGLKRAMAYANALPTADVVEVRHARWNNNGRCTLCGCHAPYYIMASAYHKSPYCFECGAKMDGKGEGE